MDFNFTDEQTMLRDSVSRYLSDTYTFDARMAAVHGDSGWNPGVWKAFAEELGILGAPFAEGHGGLGGGAIENMIVMEEIGRALVIEPYLQTVVIGGGFLKAAGGALADAVIPKIIDGSAVIAFAYAEPQGRYNLADLRTTARKDGAGYVLNGHKAVVYAAPWATHLVVTARTGGSVRERAGVSVFLIPVDAPGITRRDYPTVDGARASEVYFENVAVGADALIGAEGEALPLVERVVDEAIAAVCAEASGVVRQAPRNDSRLQPPAQAVRQADRRVPGSPAPHGRHVHGGRAGGQHDADGDAAPRRARPRQARLGGEEQDRPRRALRRPERGPDPRRHRHLERARRRPLLQARDDDRKRVRRRRLPPRAATKA